MTTRSNDTPKRALGVCREQVNGTDDLPTLHWSCSLFGARGDRHRVAWLMASLSDHRHISRAVCASFNDYGTNREGYGLHDEDIVLARS